MQSETPTPVPKKRLMMNCMKIMSHGRALQSAVQGESALCTLLAILTAAALSAYVIPLETLALKMLAPEVVASDFPGSTFRSLLQVQGR